MGCWLLSETGHNVSDQPSKISQDFLIFMAAYSACRIDSAISSFCGHLTNTGDLWSTPYCDEWQSHRLLSHSVFLACLEYFGIFGIRKVQSYVLNAERTEREVSSRWLGSPWCCVVNVCINKWDTNVFTFVVSCARTTYIQHISILGRPLTAQSQFLLRWRDTNQFLKALVLKGQA